MVYFLTVPCDHTVGQRHSIVKKEAKEKMKKRSWCGRDKEKEEKRKIAWSEIKN